MEISVIGQSRRCLLGFTFMLSCAFAFMTSPVLAQEATIFGQVTDASGGVLPGVTVTVSSPALQVRQVVEVTNTEGEYRVTPLPLGTYTIEYTLAGFQTLRREGIRLTAGFVARVDVALQVGGVAESITVSGASPVVDVKTTTTGTQLTRENLESLATSRNELRSILSLAAGARMTRVDNGKIDATYADFVAFGRSQNAWITNEGVSTTAPFSGASSYANTYSFESMEEAGVQTLAASAEAPTNGIQMNLIIKSGGNDFHGTASAGQFAKWMEASNLTDELRAQRITEIPRTLKRWDRGGDLGGRIVRDKLWFYAAVRGRSDRQTNLGVSSTSGTDKTYVTGKGTLQLTGSQKIIGSHQFEKRLPFSDGPTGRFQLNENTAPVIQQPFWTNVGKGEWQLAKGNKVLSVLGGSWWAYNDVVPAATNLPTWTDQITGYSGGASANDPGLQLSVMDLRRWEMKSTLNWYKPDLWKGNHDFKIGANFYRAAADFWSAVRGNPGDCCYSLVYRSPAGWTGLGGAVDGAGVPFRVDISNAPVKPKTKLDYVGIFFQDSWSLNRRLTLNLGVRYANDRGILPPQCREAAPAPFQVLFPASCNPEFHSNTFNSIAPRLHAAYDLVGDGKTVIKGGWGRFYDLHRQDELNLYNSFAQSTAQFRWRGDFNNNRRFDAGEANLDLNGPDFLSLARAVNNNLAGVLFNPDLKQAGTDELMASIERELMPNFGLRVTGLYVKTFNSYRVLNQARPPEVWTIPVTNPIPGEDGRLVPGNPFGTLTYWEYPATLAGAAFQKLIFVNHDPSNASYKSIDMALNKRLSNRWQFIGAFTATKVDIPVVPTTLGAAGSGQQRGVFTAPLDPNAEINAHKNLWEWQSRLTASYLFPFDIQASANLSYISGVPWERTHVFTGGSQIPSLEARVEPIGTRRLDNPTWLVMTAEKSFRLRGSHRLAVNTTILNVLNTSTIMSQGQVLDAPRITIRSGATFGYATEVPPPRVGLVTVKYSF